MEELHSPEIEKKRMEKAFLRRIKRLAKAKVKWKAALDASLNWEQELHQAELLKAHFSAFQPRSSSLVVLDWQNGEPCTLTLDPTQSWQAQVKARFRRAKKLQAGLVPLQAQYDKMVRAEQELTAQLERLRATPPETLDLRHYSLFDKAPSHRSPSPKERLPYREYRTASGLTIWVGRDAQNNERLTFTHAHGNDWWFHASHCSGSHIVLRTAKTAPPDTEAIQDALQLALYYSKARQSGEGEVAMTQKKYVSRLGRTGKPGQVQLSQHQNLKVRLNPERIKHIQQRPHS